MPETGPAEPFVVNEPTIELSQNDRERSNCPGTRKRRRFLGGVPFGP